MANEDKESRLRMINTSPVQFLGGMFTALDYLDSESRADVPVDII